VRASSAKFKVLVGSDGQNRTDNTEGNESPQPPKACHRNILKFIY